MSGILDGITVIDPSLNIAGPYCTQVLGDFGARVIKIERPGSGDDSRKWRPPEWHGESTGFLATNRNKQSICVDLDQPAGQEVVKRLVRDADVLVHAMKPGSMEARGLGYDELAILNPRLVYCAISGFGETGPWAAKPGYDPVIQAYSGIMSVTGYPDRPPARSGVPVIDMGTGLWAVIGILGALLRRAQTGQGGRVGASLMDTGIAWMAIHLLTVLAGGKPPQRLGSGVEIVVPHQAFRTAGEGWILIAAPNDRLFQALCEALEMPEVARDPRFNANSQRVRHREALIALLEQRTLARTAEAWVPVLERAGVACAPIRTADQVLADPLVTAGGMLVGLGGAAPPDLRLINLPVMIDGQRAGRLDPPPKLGAHTDVVLAGAGYSIEEVAALRAAKVIG